MLHHVEVAQRTRLEKLSIGAKELPTQVNMPIIVGAGPSGMATAACLSLKDVPCLILERTDCIASLWKHMTYDRLHLHIAKEYCELPHMPFPDSYPTFLTRQQFLDYLEAYAVKFGISPRYNERVESAWFNQDYNMWQVNTTSSQYLTRWLVVATGENAELVLPNLGGASDFQGSIIHSSQYRNGADYAGKKVLVIGCGNSGMEIALDLCNSGAMPSITVRSPFHILPREMIGKSTFSVITFLMRHFPVCLVDHLVVLYSRMVLGDITCYGLKRPKVGPLELKMKMGKTPVLDVGTLSRIKSRHIKVRPAVESFTRNGVRFVDGSTDSFAAVVLATGYKSNVPTWLHDEGGFFAADGRPSTSCPNNWKGYKGLYAAGLNGRGLLGSSIDAQNIATDISQAFWKESNSRHQNEPK